MILNLSVIFDTLKEWTIKHFYLFFVLPVLNYCPDECDEEEDDGHKQYHEDCHIVLQ